MEGLGLSRLGLDFSVQSRKSGALPSLTEDRTGWGVCFWEVGENAYQEEFLSEIQITQL